MNEANPRHLHNTPFWRHAACWNDQMKWSPDQMKRSDWMMLRSTIADELATCAKIKLVRSSRKPSQAVDFVAEWSFWSQTYDIAAPDPLPRRCRRPVSFRSAIRHSQATTTPFIPHVHLPLKIWRIYFGP
jgi:hypothetical protein